MEAALELAAAVAHWDKVPAAVAANPTKAWEKLQVKQPVIKETPLDAAATPKPEATLRFVAISDTHSKLTPEAIDGLPDGDVLVHAGDFSNTGRPAEVEGFAAVLRHARQRYRHVVVIAGNHDLPFDEASYAETGPRFGHTPGCDTARLKALVADSCTYLEDSGCEIEGVRLWGSPWQPWFYDWAFNLARGEACQAKWDLIPTDTDVLLTHGPPVGHGDLCSAGDRAGCVDLLRTIQTRVRPQFHVFGHIHEGFGQTTDGRTHYVNASTCTLRYRPTNPPIVFDVPTPAPADPAAAVPEGEAGDPSA